jgi:hypothetical protein
MHQSVLAFCHEVIGPGDVFGRTVLEVGSANVNGSVRPQIEAMKPQAYVGIDLAPGPGVDEPAPGGIEAWYPALGKHPCKFGLVVSCEMLEHAEHWTASFARMCELVAPGGALVLTCRGPGFQYHNPPDYWRFTPSDLWRAAVICGLWPTVCRLDPQVPGAFLKAVRKDCAPLIRDPDLCRDWPAVQLSPRPR